MTTGRITSDVDLYSQLRLDVYLHGRTTGRLPPPPSENGNAASRHARQNTALGFASDGRQRQARWGKDDGAPVVPFEHAPTADDQDSDYGGRAQEVSLALEVGDALRDPLLAKVALLYAKTGHPAEGLDSGTLGTRLNVRA